MGALLSVPFPCSCSTCMSWRVTMGFLPPALSLLICGPDGLPGSFSSMQMRTRGSPAWEVLTVLHRLQHGPKPWSPTCQILPTDSNLRLELNLLPSPSMHPMIDPYLASQALFIAFPTPVIQPRTTSLCEIREIEQIP